MNQYTFTRRALLQTASAAAALAATGGLRTAFAAEPLQLWAPAIIRVGADDWSDMEQRAGIEISATAKSAGADEAIQKMIVGDGNALFDAVTDNGGGMEDALASNDAIVELDPSRIPNWNIVRDRYKEGGDAVDTISWEGRMFATPTLSNADSMAYDYEELGFHPDSWEPLFDPQFKGRVSMQNDFGPTMTNTAIYLKQSGKMDIEDPSDMKPDEIKGVCEFLIDLKKKGQFRTFWTGFQNGVDVLASGEVIMSSCWEPVQVVARRKGRDIRYGTMKEGHQTWNNIIMFTKGGRERGRDEQFYALANLMLSPWFGAHILKKFAFTPQMEGSIDYMDEHPEEFPPEERARLDEILAKKEERFAVKGNSWQNVFPTNITVYQDWWSRVQAA